MKLQNSKPNETPDQRIIRCANNLLKAVVAGGYSLHSTSGVSGVDVKIYDHIPNKVDVHNVLSHWRVTGPVGFKVTFKAPDPAPETLVEDE